jgi:hypothetical protein
MARLRSAAEKARSFATPSETWKLVLSSLNHLIRRLRHNASLFEVLAVDQIREAICVPIALDREHFYAA